MPASETERGNWNARILGTDPGSDRGDDRNHLHSGNSRDIRILPRMGRCRMRSLVVYDLKGEKMTVATIILGVISAVYGIAMLCLWFADNELTTTVEYMNTRIDRLEGKYDRLDVKHDRFQTDILMRIDEIKQNVEKLRREKTREFITEDVLDENDVNNLCDISMRLYGDDKVIMDLLVNHEVKTDAAYTKIANPPKEDES